MNCTRLGLTAGGCTELTWMYHVVLLRCSTTPTNNITNNYGAIVQSWKISYGGIPNSNNLAPWSHWPTLVPQWFRPCGQCHHQKLFKNNHMAAPVKDATQQTTLSGTFWNLPEVASGTYTSTHRNPPEPSGTCLRNLHQHTPEPSGTFRNLPPEPTPTHTGTLRNLPPPEHTPAHTGTLPNLPEPASKTYTSTHRNPAEPSGSGTCLQHRPEPSGTCLQNLHHHTPEPCGMFRNLPPEPTPELSETLQNLLKPSSGTYTSTPRNPPKPPGTFLRNQLLRPAPAHTGAIWAEDPISLRCWGKNISTNCRYFFSNWFHMNHSGKSHIYQLLPQGPRVTKHMRGTLYLSACRHTVSLCGSTPATPSKTATAPSRTRRDRSTSKVKSTWPGVSTMLIPGDQFEQKRWVTISVAKTNRK